MAEYAVETFDLTKIYKLKNRKKTITANDKINLKIKTGECLGLLGSNGAGKTTFIEMLCTLSTPTSGTATVLGYDIFKQTRQIKNNIALMLDKKMIYIRVTGWDNLKFFGTIYSIKNIREKAESLAKDFKMLKWLDEYTENYSMGMKIKIALIRTLLIDRPLMILDEPTYGLDPNATSNMINTLKKKIKEEDKTILITTHRMHVANTLCDRIALIKDGVIFKVDTAKNLKKLIMDKIVIEINVKENKIQLINDLESNNFVEKVIPNEDGFIIHVTDNSYYQQIFDIIRNYKILKFREIDPTLEDVFTTLL